MKAKAVRFLRDVLGDDERADEVDDESPEDYAERKRIEINPIKRTNAMARTAKTKAELEAEIRELQDENDDLQERLDAIADLTADEDEDEDEEDDEDQD